MLKHMTYKGVAVGVMKMILNSTAITATEHGDLISVTRCNTITNHNLNTQKGKCYSTIPIKYILNGKDYVGSLRVYKKHFTCRYVTIMQHQNNKIFESNRLRRHIFVQQFTLSSINHYYIKAIDNLHLSERIEVHFVANITPWGKMH